MITPAVLLGDSVIHDFKADLEHLPNLFIAHASAVLEFMELNPLSLNDQPPTRAIVNVSIA